GPKALQCLVDIAPLALELADALDDALEPAPVLGRAGDVGFVEAQVLTDGVEREPEPPQALNENEAGPAPGLGHAGAGHPRRRAPARSARSPRRSECPARSARTPARARRRCRSANGQRRLNRSCAPKWPLEYPKST